MWSNSIILLNFLLEKRILLLAALLLLFGIYESFVNVEIITWIRSMHVGPSYYLFS